MSKFKRYDEHGFIYVFGKESLFCDDMLREQNLEQHIAQALLDDKIYEFILFYDRKGGIRYAKPEMRQFYYEMTGHNVPQKTAAKHKTLLMPRRGILSSESEPRPETPSTTVEPESELVSRRDALKIFEAVLERKHRTGMSAAIVIMDMANWLDNELQDLNFFLDTYKNHAGNDLIVFCFKGFTPQEAYRKYEHSSVAGYLTEWRNYLEETEDAGKYPNIIFIEPPSRAEIRNLLHKKHILGELAIPPSQLDAVSEEVFRAAREEALPLAGVRVRIETNCKGKTLPVLFDKDACTAVFGANKPSKTSKELLNELAGLDTVHGCLADIEKQVNNANLNKGIPAYRSRFDEVSGADKASKKENLMLHFALKGNPGTGKTTVARLLGQYLYEIGALSSGHVVECTVKDLKAEYVGGTAIKTDKRVQEALGGVLFIDEISGIVGDTRDESHRHTDSFTSDLISVLLSAMTSYPDLSVVIGGYPKDVDAFIGSNIGFARRFTYSILLPDYTGTQMAEIFRRMARKKEYTIAKELEDILVDFMDNWLKQRRNDGSWGNAGMVERLIGVIGGTRDRDHEIKIKDIPATMTVPTAKGDITYDLKKCLLTGENAPSPTEELDRLIGLVGVKAMIKEQKALIEHKRERDKDDRNSMNFLFLGNPGTGKTTVARLMGKILAEIKALPTSYVEEIRSVNELLDRTSGENRAEKIFESVAKLGGVLFIDEAYELLDLRGGQEVINTLNSFSENHAGELCIILAGYREDMEKLLKANQGLDGRFPKSQRIVFDNYSSGELVDIFDLYCAKENYSYNEEFGRILREHTVLLSKQAARKGFGNAREMREIFNACERKLALRVKGTDAAKDLFIESDIISFTRGQGGEKSGKSARERLNELTGLQQAKEKIKALAADIEIDKKLGKKSKPPLNFLFTGNPGTGKTMVARLFGEILHDIGALPTSEVDEIKSEKDLISEFLGGTQTRVAERFQSALGKVLFIDEAYRFISNDHGADYSKHIVHELVTFSENNLGDVCIILAGYPEKMKEFIRQNPGLRDRFPVSDEIPFEDYSDEDLFLIFNQICGREGFHCHPKFDDLLKQCIPVIRRSIKPEDFGNARTMRTLFTGCKQEFSLRVRNLKEIVAEFTVNDLCAAMKKRGLEADLGKTSGQEFGKNLSPPLPSKAQLAKTSATETADDLRGAMKAKGIAIPGEQEGLTEEINYARPVQYVWDMLPETNKKSKE